MIITVYFRDNLNQVSILKNYNAFDRFLIMKSWSLLLVCKCVCVCLSRRVMLMSILWVVHFYRSASNGKFKSRSILQLLLVIYAVRSSMTGEKWRPWTITRILIVYSFVHEHGDIHDLHSNNKNNSKNDSHWAFLGCFCVYIRLKVLSSRLNLYRWVELNLILIYHSFICTKWTRILVCKLTVISEEHWHSICIRNTLNGH